VSRLFAFLIVLISAFGVGARELPLEFSFIENRSVGLVYNAHVTLYNTCVDLDEQYMELNTEHSIIFLQQTAKISAEICLYVISKRLTSFILGNLEPGEYKIFDVASFQFLGVLVVGNSGNIYYYEF